MIFYVVLTSVGFYVYITFTVTDDCSIPDMFVVAVISILSLHLYLLIKVNISLGRNLSFSFNSNSISRTLLLGNGDPEMYNHAYT